MKLFACVCLVLLILEEYHCDPCLDWLFGGRRNNNDREKKISFGLGFTAKTMISGQREHVQENGFRPSYHQHHWYQPYGPNGLGDRPRYNSDFPLHGYQSYRQNRLGYRPSYQPYYSPTWYPSYRTPYPTRYGRPSGPTYNIPYVMQGGASNGIPQRTPYHRGSYGPQYDRPRSTDHGTLYPTSFGTAHQTPNGASNGSPSGAPNGLPNSTPNSSPNSAPNGSPNSAPVETGDGTPQQKQFFVTPTGIQETPAQPVDNAS